MSLANAPIILASGSETRARMLKQAGLDFAVIPASVDEESVRESMQAEHADFRAIAMALAELKAMRVSRNQDMTLVVGADQILHCEGTLYGKPDSRAGAAAQLAALSGKSHTLASAVCVARQGDVIWRHVETAEMKMRRLSDAFIARYLDAAGPVICGNAGAYAVEGVGIQLFTQVSGDHFVIQGLPLLPLLIFLRDHGVVP
jgi:septum formation protein